MVCFSVMLPPSRELHIHEETCKSCCSRFAAQNSQGWVDVLGNAHGAKLIQSLQRSFGHIFAVRFSICQNWRCRARWWVPSHRYPWPLQLDAPTTQKMASQFWAIPRFPEIHEEANFGKGFKNTMRNIQKQTKIEVKSKTYLTCAFPRILLDSGAGRAFRQDFPNGSKVRCWFIWFVGCFQKIWASGTPKRLASWILSLIKPFSGNTWPWFVISFFVQLSVDSFHDWVASARMRDWTRRFFTTKSYQKKTGPSPGLEIFFRLARSRFHLQIMVVGASKSNFLPKMSIGNRWNCWNLWCENPCSWQWRMGWQTHVNCQHRFDANINRF